MAGFYAVPNISTWNGANPFHALCSETCSSVCANVVSPLHHAASAVSDGGLLSSADCSALTIFGQIDDGIGLALGLAAIEQAAIGDEAGALLLAEAGLIFGAVGIAAEVLGDILC
jgi:hypothetical protein